MLESQQAQDRHIRKIFVGGYTKSGTTFIGRAFGLFQGVYARGELDYFRIFFDGLRELAMNYNTNVHYVNKEVYDGFGSLKQIDNDSFRKLHDKIFKHLFFNGEHIPNDCTAIVEKSPRNIFWIPIIRKTFPMAQIVAVYRPPHPVFRSFLRHMMDHRDKNFSDPDFPGRRDALTKFVRRWGSMIETMEKNSSDLTVIQYESAAKDNAALVEFLASQVLGGSPKLEASIESLSKESYLQTLPEEARAKSLVQVGPYKLQLSDEEIGILEKNCRAPNIPFDF